MHYVMNAELKYFLKLFVKRKKKSEISIRCRERLLGLHYLLNNTSRVLTLQKEKVVKLKFFYKKTRNKLMLS